MYIALTLLSFLFGLSGGVIQVRISEALTILPAFTPAAIPGLFMGCLISNLITGATLIDIIFGSLATLLGALGTYFLRKQRWLLSLPPIISNVIIVPLILIFGYGMTEGYFFILLTVALGEIVSCGILGNVLYYGIEKSRLF